MMVDKIGKSEN